MKDYLKTPLGHMLQGLAYWLSYKSEVFGCMIVEADAVSEAFNILKSQLQSDFRVKREYPYKNICNGVVNVRYADLAIVNEKEQCVCVLEFKLADSTNGRYKDDVQKMKEIKKLCPDIDCYVVMLYRISCSQKVPRGLVNSDGQATKKDITIKQPNGQCQKVRVRRVSNSICSRKAKTMKKVVCIELID